MNTTLTFRLRGIPQVLAGHSPQPRSSGRSFPSLGTIPHGELRVERELES